MVGRLNIGSDGLRFGDQPFRLISGSMHYFRIVPEHWAPRLALMKDFGLTAVQTYVPWNLHEPERGNFDFGGMLDLREFLRQADCAGLRVLLRPSPYICSECDFGGLPWWLLRDAEIGLRCTDPAFTEAVERYYARLCAEFIPFLSTRGGPIIMVAIENEYGSYGADAAYLRLLRKILETAGVDVPLYTADGHAQHLLRNGSVPGIWAGVDYRMESAQAIAHLREFQPDKPPLVCEYWSGRASHWNEPCAPRDIPPVASAFRDALEFGAHVNFYMFCGGTNFGFFNGANADDTDENVPEAPPRYRPLVTSYDVDALVAEDGRPTPKYYACRRELDEFLGKPVRPDDPPLHSVQALPDLALTRHASLLDSLDTLSPRPAWAASPRRMEQLGQGYGFLLYSTTLHGPQEEPLRLRIDGLRDRATVYLDGQYVGTYQTCQPAPELSIAVPGGPRRLQILVENMGRVCNGRHIRDPKGILTGVRWGHAFIYDWDMHPLPLDTLDGLSYADHAVPFDNTPGFYQGVFRVDNRFDTFLHLQGWTKGCAWINGFNLGRYWQVGPQQTIYIPGPLLRRGENELTVFEIHKPGPQCVARFLDHPVLCSLRQYRTHRTVPRRQPQATAAGRPRDICLDSSAVSGY